MLLHQIISQKMTKDTQDQAFPSLQPFDLCPQRQVRHPFVLDLQDCWQTQHHLYISESASVTHLNPNPQSKTPSLHLLSS